jgi:predicted Rossmann fold flavoprotein
MGIVLRKIQNILIEFSIPEAKTNLSVQHHFSKSYSTQAPVLVVIGGGAAGFFGAITAAENNPNLKVIILEQSKQVLGKVRISGGGRCNLTHACFEPKELVGFYPRGNKELLGPFYKFQPGDTMDWFEQRGVALKIESDLRVFPVSDDSGSIVHCLTQAAEQAGIFVQLGFKLNQLSFSGLEQKWSIESIEGDQLSADYVLIATGSSPHIWKILHELGHSIIDPVPSLFTFNIQHALISGLQGLSVPHAEVKVHGQKLITNGPLLITHWGLSGPAVLKMSAWGARLFNALGYRFKIQINWTGMQYEQAQMKIEQLARNNPKKLVLNTPFPGIPTRLWRQLLQYEKVPDGLSWSQVDTPKEKAILKALLFCELPVNGKSTFKEEFVTSGGISLEEVDFRTMESKLFPRLYFAGEVLDIDALTGGFNFQAAWTGGYLAGIDVSKKTLSL